MKKVIVTSTTGASACELPGQTVHSSFGIGINTENQISYFPQISPSNKRAVRLREAEVIFIDEISQLHRVNLDRIDELCKHLCYPTNYKGIKKHFGDKIVILSGDFRQGTPVVRGPPTAAIDACIKNSPLWNSFVRRDLIYSKRLLAGEQELDDILDRIGSGVDIDPEQTLFLYHLIGLCKAVAS